ncbi:unnamed protein product [Blepharisma stoltei]|uniref:Uncharacterized protein n=1 Tax=Blepharisma stoltei TaxID=1481888 RepID=A0AAU9K441_9CILI|nr:unnamed protein product [Blepharisma stoltei]
MIIFRCLRNLNRFASFDEIGKLPNELQTHLDCLNNSNNYKPWIREKPVKALAALYRAAQRLVNIESITWTKLPAVQKAIKEIPLLTDDYGMNTIQTLLIHLINLNIDDDIMWSSIEKRLIKGLADSINYENIQCIVRSFDQADKGSEEFWINLRDIIKNKICKENKMNAKCVATIVKVYGSKNLIDDKFLVALEGQVFRISKDLYGEDLSIIIYMFGLKNLGNEELFALFNKQIRENKRIMDTRSLAHCLASFIKVGQGTVDLYDDVEKEIIENPHGKQMEIGDAVGLLFAYARYLPLAVKGNAKRREFVEWTIGMIKAYINEGERLSDISVVHSLWSLCRLNILEQHEDLKSHLVTNFNRRKLTDKEEFSKLTQEIVKHI